MGAHWIGIGALLITMAGVPGAAAQPPSGCSDDSLTLVQWLPLFGWGPPTAEGDIAVIGGQGANPVLDLSRGPVGDRERMIGRLGDLAIPLLHRGFLYGIPVHKSAPARLEAYDLTNPASPVLIQRIDELRYLHPTADEDLLVVGGTISGGGGPLIAFRILPDGRLERAGDFGEQGTYGANLIEVWRNFVYAGYDRRSAQEPGHLNIHDLRDPENPLDVGRIDGPGDAKSSTLVDSILVVSWHLDYPLSFTGIEAYDLSVDPTEPPKVFSWEFEDHFDFPWSLASDDRFLYTVAEWPQSNLRVYDFAAPQPWRPIQELPLWWGSVHGEMAVADHALVRNDNGWPYGTTIFPRRADGTLGPRTRVGFYGSTSSVAIVGDHLYSDADESGVLAFKIGPTGSLRPVQRIQGWFSADIGGFSPNGPLLVRGLSRMALVPLSPTGEMGEFKELDEWSPHLYPQTVGSHAFMAGDGALVAADLVDGDTLIVNSTWPFGGFSSDLDSQAFGPDTLLALTTGSRLRVFRFTTSAGLDLIAEERTGYDTAFPGLFYDTTAGPSVIVHGDDGGLETYSIDLANRELLLLDSLRFRPRFQAWSCSVVGDQAWLGASDSLFVAQLLPGGRIGEILRQESLNTVWGHATGIGSTNRVALPSGNAGVVIYEQPDLGDRKAGLLQ
ncbi:MAG: hypothetical protein CME06_12580 [Gemmatimonadetes bacterium]|nr:hypothetical protein [Gemmatimonadota bacterium]